MPIRAVTFDAVGTLIELARPPGEVYATMARHFGAPGDPEPLQAAFRQAWRRTPPPADVEGPRSDDDRRWWHALVSQTLALAGCAVSDFEGYFERVYRYFERPEAWKVRPGVPGALTALASAGYRLGVLSNFDGRLHGVLRALELRRHFEAVIVSSEVGANKPSPRIFAAALEAFGLNAPELLHVGDDPALDGAGARAAGLEALVLDGTPDDVAQVLRHLETSAGRGAGSCA